MCACGFFSERIEKQHTPPQQQQQQQHMATSASVWAQQIRALAMPHRIIRTARLCVSYHHHNGSGALPHYRLCHFSCSAGRNSSDGGRGGNRGTRIQFAASATRTEVVCEDTQLTDEQIEQLCALPPFDGHIPRERLTVSFVRAGGPGGQNVNKVATKCDVRFSVWDADWLPEPVRLRLRELQHTRINVRGELVVQASTHRTQEQNIKDAVDRIREMVAQAHEPPAKRVMTVGRTQAGDRERLKQKKRRSELKEGRRKVRSGKYSYD